jgi:hypothetical protein
MASFHGVYRGLCMFKKGNKGGHMFRFKGHFNDSGQFHTKQYSYILGTYSPQNFSCLMNNHDHVSLLCHAKQTSAMTAGIGYFQIAGYVKIGIELGITRGIIHL